MLPEHGPRHRVRQLSRALSLPLAELVRVAAEHGKGRVAGLLGARPRSRFCQGFEEENLSAIDELRQAAYARAAVHYVARIKRFAGNVQLIVAGRRLAGDRLQDPDCGWRSHVPSVVIHTLDADHIGLVEEPSVAGVAEIFVRSLGRAERPGPFDQTRSRLPSAA
jgi:thioesterase domain-containing protein